MPRIGLLTSDDRTRYGKGQAIDGGAILDFPNVAVENFTMPENGWITHIVMVLRDWPDDTGSCLIRPGIWRASDKKAAFAGGKIGPDSTTFVTRSYSAGEIRGTKNQLFYGGLYADTGIVEVASRVAGENLIGRSSVFPGTLPSLSKGAEGMACALDYVGNEAPSAGAWRTPTPTGVITNITPTFAGNLFHGNGDGAYDETSSVQVRIWRTDNNLDIYNQEFTPTGTEKSQNYFSRQLVTLTPGLSYAANYRHKDTWGVWGNFSTTQTFTVANGPNAPDTTAPLGKVNAVSGLTHEGLYSHPDGLSSNAIQLDLRNAAGTTSLHDTGVVAKTVTSGSAWTHAQWYGPLSWGTGYAWRVRFRDTNNLWGPWSSLASFKTNSFPSAPTNLSPSGGKKTGLRLLTAKASDPDNDPIVAAQVELVNASTGVPVAGYPKAMTVAQGGALSFSIPTADLAFDTTYRWRARASDGIGPGYGVYSPYAEFFYVSAPTVSVLSPGPQPRVNLTVQPSAEHSPAASAWRETARIEGTDFVEIVRDGASYSGESAWRATTSATSSNAFEEIQARPVNPNAPYLALVALKRESGTTAASFQVLCYDGTGALIGTLHPSTVAPLQNANVPTSWAEYGGRVNAAGGTAPAWPAGTATARLRLIPSAASQAVVRFDAFSFEELPAVLAADWPTAQAWYGYADGDGSGDAAGGYAWSGASGESESLVLPVLTHYAPSAVISYSPAPASGAAKSADRLFVDRWDAGPGAFVAHSDSGWVSGSRTLIPVPAGVLANGARYRLRARVRDAAGIEAESANVEFDAFYKGPPELAILTTLADPSRAEISVSHEPPTLPASEFGGVEVAVEAADGSEPRVIFFKNTDPTDPTATYHFPKPGMEYVVMVRQVRVVGGYTLQSRWTRASARVDTEYEFLKDAENPSRLVAYETQASRLPDVDELRDGERYPAPWGLTKAYHVLGEASYKSGEARVEIYTDAAGVGSAEERWEAFKAIARGGSTIVLLTNVPDKDKVFASIQGPVRYSFIPTRTHAAEFSWEETNYSESVGEEGEPLMYGVAYAETGGL